MDQVQRALDAVSGDARTPRVLLVLGRDRRNIADELALHYDVIASPDAAELDTEFDVAILDGEAYARHQREIAARKRSEPVSLPFMLLVPPERAHVLESIPTHDIDELLVGPIVPETLVSRIEVLLSRRERELKLNAERDHLLRIAQKARAQADSAIKYAPAAIYEIDLRGPRFTFVNDAMSEITGFSHEELLSMDPLILLTEPSREVFRQRIAMALRGESVPPDMEYRGVRKDGSEGTMLAKVRVFDDEGCPKMFVVGQDTTALTHAEEEARRSEARYQLLHESLRDGFVQVLMDGCIVECNEAYAQMLGYTPEELYELTYSDLTPERWHAYEEAIVRDQILPRGYSDVYEKEYVRKDGSLVPVELRTVLATDANGEPSAMWAIIRDVTERKRVQKKLLRSLSRTHALMKREAALKQVAQVSSASLRPEELATRIAGTVANLFDTKLAQIRLMNETGKMLVSAGAFDPTGCLQPVRDVAVDGDTETAKAFRTGTVRVGEDIDPGISEQSRSDASRTGIGSYVLLPVFSAEKPIGVLYLAWSQPRTFSEDELSFMRAVATQLSVGLENARLYQAVHGIAETLQETLVSLPTRVPGVAFSRGYESATFQSGRVGGDFVDIFEIRGHLVGITLGDVSGKGIEAAVTTSLIRTTLRVHAVDGLAPASVATKANEIMRRFTRVESFVTLWFGVLNTRTGLLRYVCCGHPPAFVLPAEGGLRELESHDPILGAFEDAHYGECQTILTRGDRLVLYSDGLTEARTPKGEFLTGDGLAAIVARHAGLQTTGLAGAILDEIIDFSDGVLRDDAATLVVEATKLRSRSRDQRQLRAFEEEGAQTA